ncbi:carboxypeptidase regulatory-like domain-containing protein [Planctomicrobium sp. SH664]|uniref:carboxypeptidase regulatory-like domain-containing protein n=1 Tax=Planctomicrobium sp. SH664 TaxID=3448125 RepID=UPI003F5C45AD
MQKLFLFMGAIGIAFAAAGCNRSDDGPPVAPVSGIVKLDGKPLGAAYIRFIPTEGDWTHSSAKSNPDGTFELKYTRSIKGAVIGKHKVTITTANPDFIDEKGNLSPIPEALPPIYHAKSTLVEEVLPKGNVIEFDLKSKP